MVVGGDLRGGAGAESVFASSFGAAGSDTSKSSSWLPDGSLSDETSVADPEQQPVADRMEVGGVAGELELPGDARRRRGAEVDRVERVDLPEGDDIAGVVDEADGVDLLALPEPGDLPDRREDAAFAASSTVT